MSGERRNQAIGILGLALSVATSLDGPVRAQDIEALRAATVKITIEHSEGTSTGSGIILCQDGARVDILTAKHVLTNQGLVGEGDQPSQRFRSVQRYSVSFHRNNPLPVRINAQSAAISIQKAEYKDLALLTLTGVDAPLRTARLGDSRVLQAGADIESVGHLDIDWDWTQGTVKSVGEFIRHSSNIDHGYSGGPLFDAAGEVVGLNLQTVRSVARAMPIEEAILTVRRWIDPRCLGDGMHSQRAVKQAKPPVAAPSGPGVFGKVFDIGANPVKGLPTAKLTLIMFLDFQ